MVVINATVINATHALSPAHQPSGTGQDPTDHIHILSYNCLGLKFISKHRHARLSHIGHVIAHASPVPDIVGLQECWTQEDYLSIRHQTSHILPYGKFYHNGVMGAGLAILSRWPIVESQMHSYPLNGRPTAFFRGDWYVGKGVAHARIRVPRNQYTSRSSILPESTEIDNSRTPPADSDNVFHEKDNEDVPHDVIEVFTTHLHAPYEQEPHDSYLCHRTAQAYHMAKLIRDARERGHLAIACGDFNMVPNSLAHELIMGHGGVMDAWPAAGKDERYIGEKHAEQEGARAKEGKSGVSVRWKVKTEGATCDSMGNTWRWPEQRRKNLERAVKHGRTLPLSETEVGWEEQDWDHARRLDYVFIGNPDFAHLWHGHVQDGLWKVQSAHVGFTDRHPSLKCSLSDHFSVETTLTRPHSIPAAPSEQPVRFGPMMKKGPEPPLHVGTYRSIIEMTEDYLLRERFQRKMRILHYFASVTATIGCWIAVWFSPYNFVAFILMLIASLWLMAGTVDGLIGFLFMSSEIRCLKEFLWEMRELEEQARLHEKHGV
ncbi:MAG: hypothetical protein Q9162_003444 [Coniocarpon cinnabarinum]